MQETVAIQAGQVIGGRVDARQAAAQVAAQPLLADPGLDPQAQDLGLERLEQHVRDAPTERQGAIGEVLGAPDQEHRQVEQLRVAADRCAQALQLGVIVAGGDQSDVQILAPQPLDRGLRGLGVGGGRRAAERGHDLDLIAAGRTDQQDADPVDRGHGGGPGGQRQAELHEQSVAPAALDLHPSQARERTDPRVQLGVLDREHEHVVGAER